jgi:hypothetical protein
VTALELELYPAPVLYGGRVIWPEHRTREVYDAFLEITAEPTAPALSIARAELLTGLDADALELLLAKPVEPLINVQIRHLGGALARAGRRGRCERRGG